MACLSQEIQKYCLRRTQPALRPRASLWIEVGGFDFTLPSTAFTKSLLFLPPSSANCQVCVSVLNDTPDKLPSRCCLEFHPKCAATQCRSEALLRKQDCGGLSTGCTHRTFLWSPSALNSLLREDQPADLSARTGQCGGLYGPGFMDLLWDMLPAYAEDGTKSHQRGTLPRWETLVLTPHCPMRCRREGGSRAWNCQELLCPSWATGWLFILQI